MAPSRCRHEILGEELRRGGNPAQRGSIVRHRKIEDGALGHDISRIYGTMALVVVSLSVMALGTAFVSQEGVWEHGALPRKGLRFDLIAHR